LDTIKLFLAQARTVKEKKILISVAKSKGRRSKKKTAGGKVVSNSRLINLRKAAAAIQRQINK
jgi:hypothetical protein